MIVKKVKTHHKIYFSKSVYVIIESEADTIDTVISYKTKSLAKFNLYLSAELKYKTETARFLNLDDIQKECRRILQKKIMTND